MIKSYYISATFLIRQIIHELYLVLFVFNRVGLDFGQDVVYNINVDYNVLLYVYIEIFNKTLNIVGFRNSII